MNTMTPPAEVVSLFETAGWYPGRNAGSNSLTSASHPAALVLASFSGLVVFPRSTEGLECGTGDMQFGEVATDESLVNDWANLLQTELIGVAECHGGNEQLLIASDGRSFGLSYIHDAFYFYGDCFSEAAKKVLMGQRAKPLLHPKQLSVKLYGKSFERGSPDLYASPL